MMINVEQLKNLTIQECLKKLQHKFETFFKIFVENGKAKIKLTKDSDALREEPQTEARRGNPENYDKATQKNFFSLGTNSYSGMTIKVDLGTNNWQTLKELSGGEKSIVSLSLLFALNSLTPSQIFLLDEVDCALD